MLPTPKEIATHLFSLTEAAAKHNFFVHFNSLEYTRYWSEDLLAYRVACIYAHRPQVYVEVRLTERILSSTKIVADLIQFNTMLSKADKLRIIYDMKDQRAPGVVRFPKRHIITVNILELPDTAATAIALVDVLTRFVEDTMQVQR